MCLTWIAIIASLSMGIGSAVIFSFTVNEAFFTRALKAAVCRWLNRLPGVLVK